MMEMEKCVMSDSSDKWTFAMNARKSVISMRRTVHRSKRLPWGHKSTS